MIYTVALCLPVVSTQASSTPALVEPSIAEFTEKTAEIFAASDYDYAVQQAILNDFNWRYDADAWFSLSHDALYTFSHELWLTYMWNAPRPPHWTQALLESALREYKPDLSRLSQFAVGEAVVYDVFPSDFDGDGQVDFLLQSSPDTIEYAYFLVKPDARSPHGYLVARVPLPAFFRTQASSWFAADYETLTIGDVDNDGRTEWVMLLHEHFYFNDETTLVVWGWENNQWVDETEANINYRLETGDKPPHTLDDFDEDGTLDFEVMPEYTNNWNCSWTALMSLMWRNGKAVIQKELEREDSFGCTITDAENALLSGDAEAAIPHYERALSMMTVETDRARVQYAHIRLAAAYALTEQVEQAAAVLGQALEHEAFDDMIREMSTAYDIHPTASSICQAAYDYIAAQNSQRHLKGIYPYPYTIGETTDIEIWATRRGNPSPSDAGYNAALLQPELHPTATPWPERPPSYWLSYWTEDSGQINVLIYNELGYIWARNDYSKILQYTEAALASDVILPEQIAPVRYYRALALEALDRPDEAAAEYARIITLEPDSPWGQLAALHVVFA